jgi:transcriptional regulator
MYIPSSFAEPDPREAHALIAANPFGLLVLGRAGHDAEIAHLPFLVAPEPGLGVLRVHVARQNPIAALGDGARVVAIFSGPHGYVSPRWYEAPQRSVPTWNFTAVHAHGVARKIDDRDEVLRALADLTAQHEAGAPQPWSPEETEPRFLAGLVRGIVLFSIPIDRFETKMKLSQNRPMEDRIRVIDALRARRGPGDEALADAMAEREKRGASAKDE